MITDARLDELEALAAKATAGPVKMFSSYSAVRGPGYAFVERFGNDIGDAISQGVEVYDILVKRADWEFCAVSRAAIPELIAAVRDARMLYGASQEALGETMHELTEVGRILSGGFVKRPVLDLAKEAKLALELSEAVQEELGDELREARDALKQHAISAFGYCGGCETVNGHKPDCTVAKALGL